MLLWGSTHRDPCVAIQFAKLSGFHPIITTASLRNKDLVTSFGAAHVIDRTLPVQKVIDEVLAIANGPVDLAYDVVSEDDTLAISGAVVRSHGQFVMVGWHVMEVEVVQKAIKEKHLEAIIARVRTTCPAIQPVQSRFEPAVGALLLALEAADITIDEPLLETLTETLPPPSFFATHEREGEQSVTHGVGL